MLSVDRYETIIAKLEENKTVKVSELSNLLNVTEKTIRLDLKILEHRGLLKRIHGGAVLVDSEEGMLPVEERQSRNSDIKSIIANEAIKLIEPNETVLMDGGSTTLAIAELLGDYPITVITNDLKIANVLQEKNNIQLIVLGGTRIPHSSSLMGEQATDLLEKINVDRLFVGATGVSVSKGLTVINSLYVQWKKNIIRCAEKVTLVAESTKFDKVALIPFASLDVVDEIVTDSNLDSGIIKQLESHGIHIKIGEIQ